MNERLKELAVQAGLEEGCVHGDWTSLNWPDLRAEHLERFADLVRQDEREANAKLLEEMGEKQTNQSLLDPWDCAAAIRARSEK